MNNQWWLRSPGRKQDEAVYILGRTANLTGIDVDNYLAVRPVIRVRPAAISDSASGRKRN